MTDPSSAAPGGATAASQRELALAALGALVLLVFFAGLLLPLGPAGAVLALALGLGVPAVLVARRHGGVVPGLGLVAPDRRALLGALIAGLSFWLIVTLLLGPILTALPDAGSTEERLGALIDPSIPLVVRLALFALLPAIVEELLCRGLLCRHLGARLGAGAGVFIAALYFAALHLSLTQGLPALITGVVCGALVVRTGSTFAPIAYHFANNAAILLFLAPELVFADVLAAHGGAVLAVAAALSVLGFALVRGSGPSRETLQ
jgi:sodium transport system permease protein